MHLFHRGPADIAGDAAVTYASETVHRVSTLDVVDVLRYRNQFTLLRIYIVDTWRIARENYELQLLQVEES